jgi:2Fe-2S ferredoxin
MPIVTFIAADGSTQEVDVKSGVGLMEAAINNGIEGIAAVCGGSCSCATCHCYVDETWLAKIPAAEELEIQMLESALDRRGNSRLSCQIVMTDELDGIVIRLPESQY